MKMEFVKNEYWAIRLILSLLDASLSSRTRTSSKRKKVATALKIMIIARSTPFDWWWANRFVLTIMLICQASSYSSGKMCFA